MSDESEHGMLSLIRELSMEFRTFAAETRQFATETKEGMSGLLKRIEGIETAQAAHGLIRPSSMLAGIVAGLTLILGMVTTGAGLSYYVTMVETRKVTALERVGALEREIEAREAVYHREIDKERRISEMRAQLSAAMRP